MIEKGVAFVSWAPFYLAEPGAATFRLSFAIANVGTIEERVRRLEQAI